MLNKDAGHALLKERDIGWRIRNWTAKYPDVEDVIYSENLNFLIKMSRKYAPKVISWTIHPKYSNLDHFA